MIDVEEHRKELRKQKKESRDALMPVIEWLL
jgi:hypothetical protein